MICKYYKEYNPNPLGKETNDCVVRSLCAVTGKSWYEIYDLLSAEARKFCCPFNSLEAEDRDSIYCNILGMKKHKVVREKGVKALNVERFCKEHPKGKYLLRLAHHLMGVVDGQYYELNPGWEKASIYSFYEVQSVSKRLCDLCNIKDDVDFEEPENFVKLIELKYNTKEYIINNMGMDAYYKSADGIALSYLTNLVEFLEYKDKYEEKNEYMRKCKEETREKFEKAIRETKWKVT